MSSVFVNVNVEVGVEVEISMLVSTMPEPCQSSGRFGPTNACDCQLNVNYLYLIVIMLTWWMDGYPGVGEAAKS